MGMVTDVLSTMRGGAADRAASEALAQVVKAVQDTGKPGSITLKLAVGKLKGGDTEVEIKATITSKVPLADIPFGIYYPDDKGGLHREDPRQLSMLDRGDRENVMDLGATRMGERERHFGGATGDDI